MRVIAFGPGRLTYVLYQATYSPELNIIEMIWRKIKYDWLPFEAYNSFSDLKRALFDVLANIGISYKIAFS